MSETKPANDSDYHKFKWSVDVGICYECGKPKGARCHTKPADRGDRRSPLAKARDAWLESDEGQRCTEPGYVQPQYLRNRLEMAFLAGAKAQEAIDGQR